MRRREAGEGRIVVLALAAALCVGAAVLIVKVAGGSELTAARVLYIAVALIVYGASAATGLHLAERRPRLAPVGYLTTLVGLLAFALFVWRVLDEAFLLGGDTELPAIGLALALTMGQASLVAAYDRPEDPVYLRGASAGTILIVVGLGVLAALDVALDGLSVSPEVYGVMATLYLLGAALVVLFRLDEWGRRRSAVGSVPLDHVVIAVSDRAAATRFYTTLLGAEVVERPEGRIAFRVGEQLLNVHEADSAATPLAEDPVRPGNSDLCFAWPGSPQLAIDLVRAVGAPLVIGPVPRNGARGPGQSVYCRDPDGSLIELISYG
ncbi:MAG TPA: VOC family protein [Solirubrobacterales bacterium]|jgi:catechol 2,3-dioxygenase-like lactoylglutathione lyase family enzyme